MDRREFLKSSSLTLVGAGLSTPSALATPALVQRTRDLVLASPWPANSGGFADEVHSLARRLEHACSGRVKFRLSQGSESGIDAVTSGVADLHVGLTHGHVGHHPAFGYFAGLPVHIGLPFVNLARWLDFGGGRELWDQLSASFDTISLLAGHTGRPAGIWTVHPLTSLHDLTSQAVFSQGLARDVTEGLGAVAVEMTVTAIAPNLSDGKLRAAEWGNGAQCLAVGLPEVAKFSTTDGFVPAGSTVCLTAARATWEGLGSELQNIIRVTAMNQARRSAATASANDAIIRQALTKVYGVSFYGMPLDIRSAAARMSEAVVADVASRDRMSRRINEGYLGARAHAPAAEIS